MKQQRKKKFTKVDESRKEIRIIKDFLYDSKSKNSHTQTNEDLQRDEPSPAYYLNSSKKKSEEKSKKKVTHAVVDLTVFDPQKLSRKVMEMICLFQMLYYADLTFQLRNKLISKADLKKAIISFKKETFGNSSANDSVLRQLKDNDLLLEELLNFYRAIEVCDNKFIPHLKDWKWERLTEVKKNILRVASFYIDCRKISSKFVINEAVNLAKWFGEDSDYRFINAILQKVYLDSKLSLAKE